MNMLTVFLLHSIILLWFASFPLAATNSGYETDKLALLAFKSQLTQNPQNALTSWNESLHICDWEGISCDYSRRRVTSLDLKSRGLAGPISHHIGNMSFLMTITLYNNSFNGHIPQELGRLSRLTHLSLGFNSLEGEIPGNISCCSNLTRISLPYNNFVGMIPIELGSLAKLDFLDLGNNKFSDGIPSFIGNFTSLVTLDMSENFLGGNIPSTFHRLKNLKQLGLNICNLSGMFPPFIYNNISAIEIISVLGNQFTGNFLTDTPINLPKLQMFLIGGNLFSGHIPICLFNASGLQKIDMSDNQFVGKFPLQAGNKQNLTYLGFTSNNLGSAKSGDLNFFPSLTNCSHLQYLGIAYNNFGGVVPTSIGNFSNQLEELELVGNHIHGTIPAEIENLQSLISLDLSSNSFNGTIPKAIGNLQNLQLLYLSDNQLSGVIPSSLRNISQLFDLSLAYNNFQGSIPSTLYNQNLQHLDLSHNHLTGNLSEQDARLSSGLLTIDMSYNFITGSLPLEIGTLRNLVALDISYNNLSGQIPSTLGSCSSLENLHLQSNLLHGFIPTFLNSIKGLQYIDLSINNFYGEIPNELEKLSVLLYLNLSFNHLEGEVPLRGVFRNSSAFSVAGNNKICGGIYQLKLPKCHVLKSKKNGVTLSVKVAIGVPISLFFVALLVVIYLWKNPRATPPPKPCTFDLRRVSYNELHKATEGFSTVNLIGTGSYGSVYKGTLQQDEGLIAVKVLNLKEHGAPKSFLRECEALRELRHRNLLKILTVCSSVDFFGNDFKALVFEFMSNGSLENWLHPSFSEHALPRTLSFYQRLSIAFDVASALNYLHNDSDRPIVHCDIKPSNILLSEDMTACVGDFGLAKFLSKSCSGFTENETNSLAIRGTIGYIPPEYGMGADVSKQGDMYSFGILLLEMFTGRRPTDHLFKDGLSLHDYCKEALPHRMLEIMDLGLSQEATDNPSPTSVNQYKVCFTAVVRIGIACSLVQMDERMDIKTVLKEMDSIKEGFLSVSSNEQI